MKTPKQYTDNLKDRAITKPMLEDCLFSVNKRAKNCRDKEREIREHYRHSRYAYDKYHYEDSYREKKEEYYRQKETLLSIVPPKCIHVEKQTRRKRVYSYQDEYATCKKTHRVVYKNSYIDRDTSEEIRFYDVEVPTDVYYLFYDFGEHSFHTPLDGDIPEKYRGLEQVRIDTLDTHGEDIMGLVSAQFVRKVLELIMSREYTYVDN